MAEETTEKKKKKILPVILILIVITSVGYGISKYIYSLHHEVTDDAQVDADISPVLCRVSGYVNDIRFEDNQAVNKGDTLVLLDDRDLALKVQQAEAAVQNAEAAILVAQASYGTAASGINVAQSNIESANIKSWKAKQDFTRYSNLLAANSITQMQYDASKADKESAEAVVKSNNDQLEVAKKQAQASAQQVEVAKAQLAQRVSDLNFAKLQLSYAVITAPATGMVSRKNIQPGQFVNAGNPLCAIVSQNGSFIIANFKETQLTKMKEGQVAEVKVDAYPDDELKGTVYRFSAATGAKFSLLPPDNATGNFVKVVQRIPVKIKLDDKQAALAHLRPGMSVKVSVNLN